MTKGRKEGRNGVENSNYSNRKNGTSTDTVKTRNKIHGFGWTNVFN